MCLMFKKQTASDYIKRVKWKQSSRLQMYLFRELKNWWKDLCEPRKFEGFEIENTNRRMKRIYKGFGKWVWIIRNRQPNGSNLINLRIKNIKRAYKCIRIIHVENKLTANNNLYESNQTTESVTRSLHFVHTAIYKFTMQLHRLWFMADGSFVKVDNYRTRRNKIPISHETSRREKFVGFENHSNNRFVESVPAVPPPIFSSENAHAASTWSLIK